MREHCRRRGQPQRATRRIIPACHAPGTPPRRAARRHRRLRLRRPGGGARAARRAGRHHAGGHAPTTTCSSRCCTRWRPRACRRPPSRRRCGILFRKQPNVHDAAGRGDGASTPRPRRCCWPTACALRLRPPDRRRRRHPQLLRPRRLGAASRPGLKTLDDAFEIRRRILLAFEAAEKESDPARRARLAHLRRDRRRPDRRRDGRHAWPRSRATRCPASSAASTRRSAAGPAGRRRPARAAGHARGPEPARAASSCEKLGVEVRARCARDGHRRAGPGGAAAPRRPQPTASPAAA